MNFSLSRPRKETFLISIVIALLTILGQIVALPIFTAYGFGLLLIAYLVLVAGVLMENM